MKRLNEYLSTKVHIKHKFPKTRNLHTIIELLENCGYKNIEYNNNANENALEAISKQQNKSYCYLKSFISSLNECIYWLRIFNGGKISEKNPVYYMLCTDNDEIKDKVTIDLTSFAEYNEKSSQYKTYKYFDDFIKELNRNLLI